MSDDLKKLISILIEEIRMLRHQLDAPGEDTISDKFAKYRENVRRMRLKKAAEEES